MLVRVLRSEHRGLIRACSREKDKKGNSSRQQGPSGIISEVSTGACADGLVRMAAVER